MIIAAGGVPFVKSTVPQLLLINETNSFIWGRGKNPWNVKRSCGGSSGGEGGLVSAGCSPLGLGSDGGGSVRLPSLYCGLYGFKPTGNRFTMIGHKKPSEYTPRHIGSALGPLGKNTEDCQRMLEILMNEEMLSKKEHIRKILPWNMASATGVQSKIKSGNLRVGYIRGFEVRP
jgi:Asp-tRNA(Asn)/Glu-tRNA(Gln) amidotransferase A subunit family amidase